jgi:hypothetical protein
MDTDGEDFIRNLQNFLQRWFPAKARGAILLRRASLAAVLNGPGESYLGGLPRLPSDLQWPRDDEGAPLHFAAQIDLSDLPDTGERRLLPREGLLYFFVNTFKADSEMNVPSRTLYWPRSERFSERAPPADLSVYWPGHDFRDWLPEGHLKRGTDFRYPLQPCVIRTIPRPDPDFGELAVALHKKAQTEALVAVFGPPRPAEFFGAGRRRREEYNELMQDSCWPFVWGFVRMHAGRIADMCARFRRELNESSPVDWADFVKIVGEAADQWVGRSERYDEFDAIGATESLDYRRWIASILPYNYRATFRIEKFVEVMSVFYANACSEAGQSERVPQRWLDYLNEVASWTDHSLPEYGDEPAKRVRIEMHQMFGHWKHEHSGVEQEDRPDDILILQLDGSEVLGHFPDSEGLVHLTIAKRDLVKKDFSKVRCYL